MTRPPLPPFTRASAIEKVRFAEDSWNSRQPARVARKWARELDYRLIKKLWAFTDERIAVRFAYEFHDDSGDWFRACGNENWEFGGDGLMRRRIASNGHAGLCDLGL